MGSAADAVAAAVGAVRPDGTIPMGATGAPVGLPVAPVPPSAGAPAGGTTTTRRRRRSAPPPRPPTKVVPIARPSGQLYYPRGLGDVTDVEAIRTARSVKKHTLLAGLPGCGKSALLEAAFADTGFEVVQGDGDTDRSDFVGTWVKEGGDWRWVDGPLTRSVRRDVPLIVEEIGKIEPKVTTVLHPLMDGRDVFTVVTNEGEENLPVGLGWMCAAAWNPDDIGSMMTASLLSRFGLRFEVGTDIGLAKFLGVPARAIKVAENLTTKMAAEEVTWVPQLRELLDFVDIKKTLGEDIAIRNLLGAAPYDDRPIVASVIKTAFSLDKTPTALCVGAQV